MYTYTFSNDLRIGRLPEFLNDVSRHIEMGEWVNPDYSLEQALNGLYPAYELYFGLIKGGSNTNLILQDKFMTVINEFVKKLQYPNPRKTVPKRMPEMVRNNQSIAPLRIAVKLLYRRAQSSPDGISSISIDDYIKYILTNPTVAEGSEDIEELDNFIRANQTVSYVVDFNFYGGNPNERFVRDSFKIAEYLPFLEYSNRELKMDLNNLNDEGKFFLGDILSYQDKWNYPTDLSNQRALEESYIDYMQAIPDFAIPDKPEIELGKSNGDETNIIYYGAPGTGKSYEVNKFIKKFYPNYDDFSDSTDSEYVFRTTIHNDYSYYDFVGQIMPVTNYIDKNKIKYEFNPGIFTNALIKAYSNPEEKVFLVLEELSRGNITAIFGDIFQLLDRDLETGISDYGITNNNLSRELLINLVLNMNELEFSDTQKHSLILHLSEDDINNQFIKIPGNLYIIGTLNTSDQSVFPMDSAFKRRFSFRYISLDPVPDSDSPENNFVFKIGKKHEAWISFYQGINKFIQDNFDVAEDKFIGQFFIIGKLLEDENYNTSENRQSINHNTDQIKDKLLNYLFNDVESLNRISNSEVSLFNNKNTSPE